MGEKCCAINKFTVFVAFGFVYVPFCLDCEFSLPHVSSIRIEFICFIRL